MFKKILLLLFLLSPFLFTFIVGYPVVTPKQNQQQKQQNTKINISQRCYAVDDLKTYFNCFADHPRLMGFNLIKTINTEVSMMYPGFGIIISIAFLLQIFLLIKILSNNEIFKSGSPPARG